MLAIILVSLVIIIIFWTLIILFSFITTGNTDNAQVYIQCPAGKCATNIYNGEKRCPASPTDTVVSDAGFEICVSPGLCDDARLPYAVQLDQSTSNLGICEVDPNTQLPTQCRCLSYQQCPDYVLSAWEVYTGNPYVGLSGQRTSFTQFNNSDSDPSGNIKNGPPISFQDNGLKFCFASVQWLPRSTPGCTFIQEDLATIAQDITVCMGQTSPSQTCGPEYPAIVSNPCNQGVLAFVTPDSQGFNADLVLQTPLACVRGQPCASCDQVAIYDTSLGSIVCKSIV